MDDGVDDLDELFAMARRAEKAPPLAVADVMRRLEGLSSAPPLFVPPLRLCIGLGSAAAVAAVVVAAFALARWPDLGDPLRHIGTLPDVISILKIG